MTLPVENSKEKAAEDGDGRGSIPKFHTMKPTPTSNHCYGVQKQNNNWDSKDSTSNVYSMVVSSRSDTVVVMVD
jgi:hypothetical protein